MPEGQNQEQIEFKSQLEIQLAISGVADVNASLQDIINYEKESLSNISSLKKKYGGFDNAIKAIIKRHKERFTTSTRASKIELTNQKKLIKGYGFLQAKIRGYAYEIKNAAEKMILPASLGSAISTTLEYNKALLVASANVNRLGLGLGYLQTSLERISRETSLTRQETVRLFDKYQESMRFISLQQFEGTLKRIKSIVGANTQEIGKMQGAIASVSQEYPDLAMGLANLKKAGSGLAASEKAVIQERVRSLYFIGKIGDAQYKQITSYISGSQQVIGVDKARQQAMQAQIEATNRFKQQWEAASMAIGRGLLPVVQELANILKTIQEYTKNWDISLGKIIAAYAAIKIGSGALSALGGMAIGGGRRIGGGLLSGIGRSFGRKGGVTGKFGKIMSGAGSFSGAMGSGSPVFVTNWPLGLGLTKMLGGGKRGGLKGGFGVGKRGGFASGIKSRVPGALGKFGVGATALGISHLGKMGGEKLEESGYTKLGGAVSTGSSLLGVGGAAYMGAAIGTMIAPGIGTAIGGVLGGVVGIVQEWKNISSSFKKMIGMEGLDKKMGKRPFEDLSKTMEELNKELGESKEWQGEIEKEKEKDIASLGEKGISKLFSERSAEYVKARDELVKEREIVDKEIAAKFKERGFVDIDTQKQYVAGMKRELNIREAKGYGDTKAGKKQRIDNQNALESAEKRLKQMEKIESEAEEGSDELKNMTKEFKYQESLLGNIETLMSKQPDLIKGINSLYQAQVGYVDALIERMSILGDTDPTKAFVSIEEGVDYIDAEIKAQRTLINMLNTKNSNEAIAAAKTESQNKKWNKMQKSMFKELSDLGVKGFEELDIKQKVIDANAVIIGQEKKKTELYAKAGGIHSDTLKLVQAQATGAGLLVQLADNYAIGVGASASLRKREYEMLGKNIRELGERFKTEQESHALFVKNRDVTTESDEERKKAGEENKRLQTIMKNTQNEQLQLEIKRASIVRSMRDAWVSAISAMNVGMDGFTEIIMNAEQNTAQIQMLDGAVRSSVSGAYALRDAFGRVIEDVGFQASEAMNVFGDIYGRGGRQLWEPSYISETEKRMGITRETGGIREIMESAARGDIRSMIGGQISATEYAAGGNFEVHAATGHKYTLSALAGQESYRKSAVGPSVEAPSQYVNSVNFVLDNLVIHIDKINGIDELATKVKTKVSAKMGEIVNELVGDFTDPTQH